MQLFLIFFLSINLLNSEAQIRIGVNSGIGIGFDAPEQFGAPREYAYCNGKNQIKQAAFLYNSALYFKKSSDLGRSWSDSVLVFASPSPSSCMVNSNRINVEPRIACDLSRGEFDGRIYIVWSDQKNGKNNLDLFLVYSEDEGKTWTEPLLLTYYPNHKHQLRPDIQVNPKNGTVLISYLDQQNFINEQACDLRFGESKNGGLSFNLFYLNAQAIPFTSEMRPKLQFGEKGISCDLNNKGKSFSCDINLLSNSSRGKSGIAFSEKSFTFSNTLEIPFELSEDSKITVMLNKPLDASFQLKLTKKKYKKGKNKLLLKSYFLNLPSDNYILALYNEKGNNYVWINQE